MSNTKHLYKKAANAAINLVYSSGEELTSKNIINAVDLVLEYPSLKDVLEKDTLIQLLEESKDSFPFKPRARLLLQLGDQLIRSESVALLELVKNSYDADANKVDVLMEKVDHLEEGIIIVEDDGFGMDLNTVVNVWMEPGSDFKTEQYLNKELTPKYKRLPIGEKGIGRFGAHKLGNEIELITRKKDCKEVYVKIDWQVFESARYLEDVPVKITERTPELFTGEATGTRITITNLRSDWTRGTARKVQRAISALTSPFESKDDFTANFEVLDKPGWFEGIVSWEDVVDYSLFHFKAEISKDRIQKFEYNFTPWPTMNEISGRGHCFFSAENKIDKTLLAEIEKTYEFNKILNDQTKDENPITLADKDIGTINFEGYIFDLDSKILSLGNFEKTAFKNYLKENGGVRVFRDGLRIYDYGEPGTDWLGLDIRRVNIPARRLSNNILIAAVYLDRESSSGLIEKTNREGFVENESYETLKNSVLHTLSLVEMYRMPDKNKLREIYGPTPKSEPVLSILRDMQAYVIEKVREEPIKKKLTGYIQKIEVDYKQITETLLKSAGAGLSLSVVIHEVEKIIQSVQSLLKQEKTSDKLLHLVEHLSGLIKGYAEILRTSTRTNESLTSILNQSIFNVEFRLDNHQVKVEKKYESRPDVKVKLAKSLLLGSLMNIIDNSIYWLEKAGRQEKKLLLDIQEDKNSVYLIIADNGTGFTLPTEQITEPFMSGKSGGMGLGLHIVKEIMLAHNGLLKFPEKGELDIPKEYQDGAIVALTFKK